MKPKNNFGEKHTVTKLKFSFMLSWWRAKVKKKKPLQKNHVFWNYSFVPSCTLQAF